MAANESELEEPIEEDDDDLLDALCEAVQRIADKCGVDVSDLIGEEE